METLDYIVPTKTSLPFWLAFPQSLVKPEPDPQLLQQNSLAQVFLLLSSALPPPQPLHTWTQLLPSHSSSVITVWFRLQVPQVSKGNQMSLLPLGAHPSFQEVQTKTHSIRESTSSCQKPESVGWKHEWNNSNAVCCLLLERQQGEIFRNENAEFVCCFSEAGLVCAVGQCWHCRAQLWVRPSCGVTPGFWASSAGEHGAVLLASVSSSPS